MLGKVGVNARVNPAAWPSARSQVEYEARIMDDNAPEAGCAQANAGEQKLDPGQQFSIHRVRLALRCSCYVLYGAPSAIGNTL